MSAADQVERIVARAEKRAYERGFQQALYNAQRAIEMNNLSIGYVDFQKQIDMNNLAIGYHPIWDR